MGVGARCDLFRVRSGIRVVKPDVTAVRVGEPLQVVSHRETVNIVDPGPLVRFKADQYVDPDAFQWTASKGDAEISGHYRTGKDIDAWRVLIIRFHAGINGELI